MIRDGFYQSEVFFCIVTHGMFPTHLIMSVHESSKTMRKVNQRWMMEKVDESKDGSGF